jgi:hypothetical protein
MLEKTDVLRVQRLAFCKSYSLLRSVLVTIATENSGMEAAYENVAAAAGPVSGSVSR